MYILNVLVSVAFTMAFPWNQRLHIPSIAKGASHFCLVPMGTSSWTNHLYEAFFAGCIPVILSTSMRRKLELELVGASWSYAGYVGLDLEVAESSPYDWIDHLI